MALGALPAACGLANVVAPGTSVAFSVQPPDNCHTILVTNPDTTNAAVVWFEAAGGTLVPGVNGQRVPPGASATLAIGPATLRGTVTNFVADAIGGAIAVEATYLNQAGPS